MKVLCVEEPYGGEVRHSWDQRIMARRFDLGVADIETLEANGIVYKDGTAYTLERERGPVRASTGKCGDRMSWISERIMRGDHVSKSECMEHSEEITRLFDCYGAAMDAYDKAQKLPPCTRCGGEYGYADETCKACGSPFCSQCLSRH